MDAEDLDEFGIAPKKITASDDFASVSSLRKRKAQPSNRSVIPDLNLEDLILPSRVPIGMRLLKKMGWKEGQGVGPRVQKKKKKKPAAPQPGMKVYGCAFRPPEDESSSDDNVPDNVTFAPKDISPFNFDPKDNLHGIGYRGLDPKAALQGHVNLFEPPAAVTKSGNKGITGHAFGVGALNEDDDEDVYGVQSMIGYDRELTDEKDANYGWTAPKHKQGYSNQLALKGPDQIGKLLAGFTLGSKPLKSKKIYAAHPLPRDFRPIHDFKKPVDILGIPIPSPPETVKKHGANSDVKLDANTRGAILGEKSLIGSIFDLVSKEDKEKMKAAKDGTLAPKQDSNFTQKPSTSQPHVTPIPAQTSRSETSQATSTSKTSIPHQPKSPNDSESQDKGHDTSRSSWKDVTSGSTSGHAGFKPFAKEPEKQARYEQYLEAQKHGRRYETEEMNRTEWERQHEHEEFAKAAKLYKPLAMMMATRFTRGKYDDNDETGPADEKAAISDVAKAAEMKMYGAMTREVIEWHPDKLLCRRFNVANPFPDSSQVGSYKERRDKFSVFNFLNNPKAKEEKQRSPPRAIEFKEDSPPPPQEGKQTSSRPAVSFVIGVAKKKDSVEITKEEALQSISPGVMDTDDGAKDTEEKQKENLVSDERPPMDLFKAIFDASESSSSSSSEEEEEKVDKIAEQKQTDNIKKQSQQNEPQQVHRFLLPSQRGQKSRWDTNPVPETDISQTYINENSTSEDKSVPMELDCVGPGEVIGSLASAHEVEASTSGSNVINDRLGFNELVEKQTDSDDESAYGPQPLFLPMVPVASEENSEKKKTDGDKHRKKKHKHKDKHKHKKKKNKKEKKSKHKKKKKHKEHSKHKHKKKPLSSESSGSDTDSDASDSSNEAEPSTRDLLSKIRNLPGKRLSAADFM